MGNSLRCCLACVLPCGALDLVRIVHLSGRVDEYGRAVLAGEVLAAHPNHVLSRPCGSRQQGGPRIVIIVSPEAELERGEIYFLLPAASVPADAKKKTKKRETTAGAAAGEGRRQHRHHVRSKSEGSAATAAFEDRHQQQQQHRRRMSTGSHAASWHPHLARIAEDP